MEKLHSLLQQRMDQHHLGTEALAATVLYNINSLSDGTFTATRYKNGVLTITVPTSTHASEVQSRLHLLKQRFIERVAPNPINRVYIRQSGSA